MWSIFSAGVFSTGIFRSILGSTGTARRGTEQACGALSRNAVKPCGWTVANFFHWNQLGGAWKSEDCGSADSWASRAEQLRASVKTPRPIPTGLCHKWISRGMARKKLLAAPAGQKGLRGQAVGLALPVHAPLAKPPVF